MTFKVQLVPTQFVNQTWEKVEPFIKSAEEKFGRSEYTTEQIKVYLVTGQMMLLVATNENNEIHKNCNNFVCNCNGCFIFQLPAEYFK